MPPESDTTLERIAGLLERQNFEQAEADARQALGTHPESADLARLHGIALLQLNRHKEAIDALDNAVALAPRNFQAHCNLGTALARSDQSEAAVACFRRALELEPGHPIALNGLAGACLADGDLQGAREAYRLALEQAPRHPGIGLNLAAVELQCGHASEARALLEPLQEQAPADAGFLLGQALEAQGLEQQALDAYTRAERAAPQDPRLPHQRGLLLDHMRQISHARQAYARALELEPSLHAALSQLLFAQRKLCDWNDLGDLSARVIESVHAGAPGITPFAFLAEDADAAAQLECARTQAGTVETEAAPRRRRMNLMPPRPTRHAPLRVGFMSNGFGEHPTGLLVVAMLEALSEAPGLQLHGFSRGGSDGSIRKRLCGALHHFHDVATLSSEALARAINAQGVELLVDLRGWGGGNVADALALRPAPLQINWLAYPGTSGAPWIDYVIADRYVLPQHLRTHFSEHVAWLPRCFQPSDPTREIGHPPSREACDLPAKGTVFTTFNNSYKINPHTFARGMEILRNVPGSVWWLLSGPDGADERLRTAATAAGVDATRLVFMHKQPHAEYLARYRHADLFLDSNPYNAHTTASDALWAGCPVLSRPGETFASRVAGSLNYHLGMAQMNCGEDQDFVETAIQLGRDRAALASLRTTLLDCRKNAALFDMRGFARDFAALLESMADRQRTGHSPADIG